MMIRKYDCKHRNAQRNCDNRRNRDDRLMPPIRYNPDIHHRRSIRLPGYDYSNSGAYFITLCVHNRACLFGEIVNGQMVLNDIGKIVADEWMKSGEIRDEIEIDEWVVMPNHFHGIVLIHGRSCPRDRKCGCDDHEGEGGQPVVPTDVGAVVSGPRPKSIGSLMSGFKSAVTKRINESCKTPGKKLWHRNYYEHIIRSQNELYRIRKYIINNPKKWASDRKSGYQQ